jgi:hypothetical protein
VRGWWVVARSADLLPPLRRLLQAFLHDTVYSNLYLFTTLPAPAHSRQLDCISSARKLCSMLQGLGLHTACLITSYDVHNTANHCAVGVRYRNVWEAVDDGDCGLIVCDPGLLPLLCLVPAVCCTLIVVVGMCFAENRFGFG